MAVPTIVANLITTVYNLVDTYFVSTLGTAATAAVSVNSSLERIITLAGSLLGSGACSYIARLLGGKRKEDADRVMSTSFFTGVGAGLLLTVFGLLFMGPLVRLLGARADYMQYSLQYATYVLLAAPFMVGSLILNMCLRSEGSAMLSMVGIGFGGVLNCALDPLFINGLNLGVAGASMATAISKTVSFCILIYPYVRKKCQVRLALRRIRYLWEDIKNVLSIGATSFFRSVMLIVANILMNHVAGGISTAAMAAVGVANRVMELPFAMILGFGQGYQPVVGYNWGAKQWGRVRESFSFSSKVALLGAVAVGGAIALLATPIVHVFNKEQDAAVLAIGVLCIRLQCLALPAHAWGTVVNMFYAGIGKAKQALLMSTARQGYCFLPTVLVAPLVLGVNGVAAAQAIADCLSLAAAIPLGLGVHRIVKRQETLSADL